MVQRARGLYEVGEGGGEEDLGVVGDGDGEGGGGEFRERGRDEGARGRGEVGVRFLAKGVVGEGVGEGEGGRGGAEEEVDGEEQEERGEVEEEEEEDRGGGVGRRHVCFVEKAWKTSVRFPPLVLLASYFLFLQCLLALFSSVVQAPSTCPPYLYRPPRPTQGHNRTVDRNQKGSEPNHPPPR